MRYLNSKCHGGSNMPFNLHSIVSAMKTKKITYKILYNEQKWRDVTDRNNCELIYPTFTISIQWYEMMNFVVSYELEVLFPFCGFINCEFHEKIIVSMYNVE